MNTQQDPPSSQFLHGFGTGAVPGSPLYTGAPRDFDVEIHVFTWTQAEFEEKSNVSIQEAAAVRGAGAVSWVNVSGIHDAELVRRVGESCGLHALSIEDVLNPRHRPKVEHYPGYVYLVLKMAQVFEGDTTTIEQVSLILGKDYVLTFQEHPADVFDGVRQRLRDSDGRIRTRGNDYLAYALMDAVVDAYVELVERIGERIETAEQALDEGDPTQIREVPGHLHGEKRELLAVRKALVPLRDAVAAWARDDGGHIQKRTQPYLRDLEDHLVHLVDSVDMCREMIASLLNLQIALVGQKTNEEMRILTVVATIFIPLTFIAGVYGMNFEHMPELHYRWGYPVLLGTMLAVAVGLLVSFRRRRWL